MSEYERIPPFDEEAEGALLGSCMMEGLRLMPVLTADLEICTDSFFAPAHRLVWDALMALHTERSAFIDAVTVGSKLRVLGTLDRAGGLPYLDKLTDSTPTAAHGIHYATIVRERWLARRVIEWAQETAAAAYASENIEAMIGTLSDEVMNLCVGGKKEATTADLLDAQIAEWELATKNGGPIWEVGVPWNDGKYSLDYVLGGLEPGLTIVAARPSVGKTTFEAQVSDFNAMQGKRVARITLDMTAQGLLSRSMCRMASVSGHRLRAGYGFTRQIDAVRKAADEIKDLPFEVNSSARDIGVITSWIRMQHMRKPLDLITLDFAQLVGASSLGRNQSDGNLRVGYVSMILKALSLELKVPVLLLSQLSRPAKGKEDKPPVMSDLRDSGELEQNAAKIIALFMDNPTARKMGDAHENIIQKIRPVRAKVLKNQQGTTGTCLFWLHAHYFKFDVADPGFGDWEQVVELYRDSVNQGDN